MLTSVRKKTKINLFKYIVQILTLHGFFELSVNYTYHTFEKSYFSLFDSFTVQRAFFWRLLSYLAMYSTVNTRLGCFLTFFCTTVLWTSTRYLYFVLNLKTLTLYLMSGTLQTREYWRIYRGPSILAVVGFGSSPTLFPPWASCLSFSVFFCVSPIELIQERGEGVSEEPNHTTARKPGAL